MAGRILNRRVLREQADQVKQSEAIVSDTASVAARARAPEGMRWVPVATLAGEALPNVMRKVVAHGLGV